MTEFKSGDRVRVYFAGYQGNGHTYVGSIVGINENGMLKINYPDLDGVQLRGTLNWVHPKQCRKLKKVERRRVWMSGRDLEYFGKTFGTSPANYHIKIWNYKPPNDDLVEMVEVRQKK